MTKLLTVFLFIGASAFAAEKAETVKRTPSQAAGTRYTCILFDSSSQAQNFTSGCDGLIAKVDSGGHLGCCSTNGSGGGGGSNSDGGGGR